jgi:uncharacterized protein YxeA
MNLSETIKNNKERIILSVVAAVIILAVLALSLFLIFRNSIFGTYEGLYCTLKFSGVNNVKVTCGNEELSGKYEITNYKEEGIKTIYFQFENTDKYSLAMQEALRMLGTRQTIEFLEDGSLRIAHTLTYDKVK